MIIKKLYHKDEKLACCWFTGHCVIKELSKIEGEASANNRKAKLFFFYEWELTASWKG